MLQSPMVRASRSYRAQMRSGSGFGGTRGLQHDLELTVPTGAADARPESRRVSLRINRDHAVRGTRSVSMESISPRARANMFWK